MKKTSYLLLISFFLFHCQSPKPKDMSCAVTDNLIGKQYLDHNYIAAIANIEVNKAIEQSTEDMVFIKGGTFEMGGDIPEGFEDMPDTALPQADELPKHRVAVSDFYMDTHEVTVGEFARFIKATNYKTVAEYDINWEELKKQLPENTPKPESHLLKAGALLFQYIPESESNTNMGNWWTYTSGINWKNPDGTNPTLDEIKDQPVTQVSWYDALAYAKWCGKRLPTEAEYEYAMRAGKNNTMYPWGNQKLSDTINPGNFLQGRFPYFNTKEDGYKGVAPVKQFPANAYGLYDISGNVWEWTSDWYSPLYYTTLKSKDRVTFNPEGPLKTTEVYQPEATNKVVRGGSFLCHDSWCSGYRNSRRMRLSPDTGMQHVGFRLVRDHSNTP